MIANPIIVKIPTRNLKNTQTVVLTIRTFRFCLSTSELVCDYVISSHCACIMSPLSSTTQIEYVSISIPPPPPPPPSYI